MTVLPAGLGFLDPVLLPRTAGPGSAFHRSTDRPTVTGCGQTLAELVAEAADVALGMGCPPCVACWPPPAAPIYPGGPRLRPAALWPSTGAGYRSGLGRTYEDERPPRPPVPAPAVQLAARGTAVPIARILRALLAPPQPGVAAGLADLVSEDAVETVELPPTDPTDPRVGRGRHRPAGRVWS